MLRLILRHSYPAEGEGQTECAAEQDAENRAAGVAAPDSPVRACPPAPHRCQAVLCSHGPLLARRKEPFDVVPAA
ncbi:MAG: hypothetical protein WBR33_13560 [Pseudonocardiaceae bacterium]